MRRREFLGRSVLAGAGLLAVPGAARAGTAQYGRTGLAFLTERTRDAMLFPRPGPGAVVGISPPGLAWLPAKGASGYRVEIRRADGPAVYQKSFGRDPVHLPDRVLGPGEYRWDVVALDETGREAARRGWQAFSIPEGVPELCWVDPAVLLARVPEEHSRLIYTRSTLEEIRATLGTTRRRSWEACLASAEHALALKAPAYPKYQNAATAREAELEYRQYFHSLRQHLNGLPHLSLAFLITEEPRYAEVGKRILLEVASWPTGYEDVTSVYAHVHGTYMGEPGLGIAASMHGAYDWLYAALSAEERRQILQACEARAWQAHRRLVEAHDYQTNPGGSHPNRLIPYLVEMAIVMTGEAEGAPVWLDYALRALTTTYPHWGGSGGGWAEGVGYAIAYNGTYMPALEALRIGTGYDLWQRPFFRQIRSFFLYCTALRGEIRPFGDGAEREGPAKNPAFGAFMAYHAHLFNDPHSGWWAEEVGNWNGSSGELALVFEDDVPSAAPTELPNAHLFPEVGWAGLHSDLASPDADTFFLFKSSPYGSVSHSHADQNSFAIMKGGRALAIPSGYYGPSYGMPHHAEWTRSTKANNTVLVDGQGQQVRTSRATGRITAFDDRNGLCYVAGDAATAYVGKLERFHRHVLFLRPGLFLLLDDLRSRAASRFQWMLHALEEMEVDDGAGRVVSSRGGATLEVHLRSPAGLRLSQTDQFDTPFNAGIPERFHEDRTNHWHLTAETAEQAAAARIAAVMAVRGPGERLDVELLEHDGWVGARAMRDGETVEGWVQTIPGAPGPEGYDAPVSEGRVVVCGRAADGDRLEVMHT